MVIARDAHVLVSEVRRKRLKPGKKELKKMCERICTIHTRNSLTTAQLQTKEKEWPRLHKQLRTGLYAVRVPHHTDAIRVKGRSTSDSPTNPIPMHSFSYDGDSQDASQLLQSSQFLQEPDMSVLERMKRRLGLINDTQVIETEVQTELKETQVVAKPMQLAQLPVEDAEIQFLDELPDQTEKEEREESPQKPEMKEKTEIKEAEMTQQLEMTQEGAVTQKVETKVPGPSKSEDLSALFLSEESDEEDRQQRINQLVKHKQQERERQAIAEQLEADVSRTTLTDDENDLEEETLRSVPNHQLEETEQFLSVQKRERNIEPQFNRKVIHSKQKLLSAFDDDILDSDVAAVTSLTPPEKSSPLTSPVQKDEASDGEDEELNVLDLIGQPVAQQAKSIKKKSPIEVYASKLKEETENSKMINLDSDSDSHSQQQVPSLSKQDKLSIKQRFSRKKLGKKSHIALALPTHLRSLLLALRESRTGPKRAQLLSKLKRANIDQIQALRGENGENDLLEELQKDEEVMGSLLEREMERARNIRKKEKMREKQKKADLDHLEAIPESDGEIPDSDLGDSGANDFDDNDSDGSAIVVDKRKRVVLLSEDDDSASDKETNSQPKLDFSAIRVDDSYMFGALGDDENAGEQDIITTSSQRPPISYTSPKRTRRHSVAEQELFKNLKDTTQKIMPIQNHESQNHDDEAFGQVPSFQDLLGTQADPIPTQGIATQVDDDEVTPATLDIARKLIKKNDPTQQAENEEEEEEAEKDDTDIKEQIKMYERKLRLKELQSRKRRHVMAQKGLNKIIEGEAEESEDEWHGLGGMDGELSDVANSEDEKMIDNSFNFDLNDAEVKRKFMEQYQIKDQKELEKLLDDIKNHRLTKRVRPNGLDIELSDEEDEILAAYRKQKLNEQRQRALQNKQPLHLSKTERAKAFFESMEEDSQRVIRIDDDDEDEEVMDDDKDEDEDDIEAETTKRRRVIRIEESFVQKQLSFLSSTNTDQYFEQQRTSRLQHGFGSDEEHEDLKELKRSISEMNRSRAELVTEEPPKKQGASDTDDDDIMPAFKRPSLVQSFRSNPNSGSEGSFSGVTISKQYKAATGGKASISSMSRSRRVKSVKEQKLERRLNHATQTKTKLFSGSGFD